ncbi:MAG: hypothetical protein KDD47_11995, partial [Acidobacteria bacterium]|nr:hypothetical protein [Acidobacteriota bacterium]
LARLLAKDPVDRFASARELAEAVTELERSLPPSVLGQDLGASGVQDGRTRVLPSGRATRPAARIFDTRSRRTVMALGIVLCLGLAGWLGLRRGTGGEASSVAVGKAPTGFQEPARPAASAPEGEVARDEGADEVEDQQGEGPLHETSGAPGKPGHSAERAPDRPDAGLPPREPSRTPAEQLVSEGAGDVGSAVEPEPEAGAAAEEPEAKVRPGSKVPDQVLDTGLALSFEVQPPDALVSVNGRRPQPLEKRLNEGSAFHLPGPGQYHLVFRRQGYLPSEVLLRADGEIRGTTIVAVSLEPLPEGVSSFGGSLERYEVRKAVALRVVPPRARVMVDGEMVGVAARFSGGAGGWLTLSPGLHRILVSAIGHRPLEVEVLVTETAEKDLQILTLHLPRKLGS